MDTKTRTMVNIGGKEYALAGFESEEYIHRVAIYVDRKQGELAGAYPGLSTNMLSVLTAINLADDLLKAQEQIRELSAELESTREQLKKVKIERAMNKDEAKKPLSPKKAPHQTRLFDSLK